VETCIVHLIRHALSFISWQDRKAVVAGLRPVYHAVSAEAGLAALEDFEASALGRKYPTIAPSWRRHWPQVVPFFAFPAEVRWIIYTTNAIESLNSKLRTAFRSRGHFPSDAAAVKLIYLVLRRVERDWKMSRRQWIAAKNQFAILFADRFVNA